MHFFDGLLAYFRRNGLLVFLLLVSIGGHLGLGYHHHAAPVDPRLNERKSGRTSVRVQLISIAPPQPQEMPRDTADKKPLHDTPPPPPPPKLPQPKAPQRIQVEPKVEPIISQQHQSRQKVAPAPVTKAVSHEADLKPQKLSETIPRKRPPARLPAAKKPIDAPKPTADTTQVSEESRGAEVPPRFLSRPEPVYPRELWLRRIEGRVMLKVVIGTDGRASSVEVHTSSGHAPMDRSAITAVRRWRFAPAKRGNQPVRKAVVVPIRFRINR